MIKIKNKTLKNYKFIDLFAGIGGFHLALNSFGAECVFVSEWDKEAAKTYYENFNKIPNGDITLIDEKEIPTHDIICGGFPCQAFSVSGKQKGFEDTRGTLFFDVARIINHHKPKVIFLENVKNLVKHNNGDTFKTITSTLKELGYNVYTKVLNSSNYGLPQNRERIFFVGFRNDINSSGFEFPKTIEKTISLNDILENEPLIEPIKRNDISLNKLHKVGGNLFNETQFENKPIQIGIVNKGGQGERIYHPNGHAITLSAYGGGVGSKTGLYYINDEVRKLTPRECARVQGFPDTYKINNKNTQAYKQFGNSVSVDVLQYVLLEINKVLENN